MTWLKNANTALPKCRAYFTCRHSRICRPCHICRHSRMCRPYLMSLQNRQEVSICRVHQKTTAFFAAKRMFFSINITSGVYPFIRHVVYKKIKLVFNSLTVYYFKLDHLNTIHQSKALVTLDILTHNIAIKDIAIKR